MSCCWNQQGAEVASAPALFQNLAELPLENWDGFLAQCFYLISLQIKKRSNRRHMFSISFTCVLLCLKERGMKCLASFFFQSVCRQLQVLITTAKSSSEKGDCGLSATPVIVFSPEKGKRCGCRESRINICWSDETLNVSLQLPLGRGERGGKEGEKEKRKKRNLFIALPYYLMTCLSLVFLRF